MAGAGEFVESADAIDVLKIHNKVEKNAGNALKKNISGKNACLNPWRRQCHSANVVSYSP
jgi:hypothetical protein